MSSPKKLNKQLLVLAHKEAMHHLMSDLNFTMALHDFMKEVLDSIAYFSAEYGFRKFLHDYGVNRTLQAGDLSKIKLLELIKNFPFGKSHADDILQLANKIQQGGLSSNSTNGSPGLPQSFCSKFLYVMKPDTLIPYDSYVLKSLQFRTGQSLKTLELYYQTADQFRQEFFPEKSDEVKKIVQKSAPEFRKHLSSLDMNINKVLSWKLTDKYLWCEEYVRKSKA